MKKIPLHLLTVRGSLGKRIVVKHYGKKVIITRFPDMSNIVASAEQRVCRNVFREAVTYARNVIADPKLKKEWQKRLRRRNGVYNAAIKEYMLKAKQASNVANNDASRSDSVLVPVLNPIMKHSNYSQLKTIKCQTIKSTKENWRETG